MDCGDSEFVAENETISIIPNFNERTIHLISGDVGPFEAGMQVEVPLWLGISLKTQHKCRIVPPEWLNVERLEGMISSENENDDFGEVPEHFFPVAQLLFRKSPEDIPNSDQVKVLIKDLCDNRASKLRKSIRELFDRVRVEPFATVSMSKLTQFEICVARPFLVASLNQVRELQSAASEVAKHQRTRRQ